MRFTEAKTRHNWLMREIMISRFAFNELGFKRVSNEKYKQWMYELNLIERDFESLSIDYSPTRNSGFRYANCIETIGDDVSDVLDTLRLVHRTD